MRRRESFPKPGERVRLTVPAAPGAEAKERTGTVLERSCGKSGALRVRWDAEGDRPSMVGWLADATWHWSHAHLRVAPAAKAAPPAIAAAPAQPVDDDVPWAPRSTGAGSRRRAGVSATTGSGAAAAEWEAALAAETAPMGDGSWEDVLSAALGLGPAAPAPATPTPNKNRAATATAPAPATLRPAPSAPSPTEAPAPPAPEPVPVPLVSIAPPPSSPRPWVSDDILPNRGGRRGRKRD